MTNDKEVPATRRRPMGLAWGMTFVALSCAIGSYYRPGPLQIASFVFVGLSLVCLIIARRDELKEHNDLVTSLRLEADQAHGEAAMWQDLALMEAGIIRAQGVAIAERDESAQEIIERWAESIRPSTSARKAMAWMDARSVYSTLAAAIFAARSGEPK